MAGDVLVAVLALGDSTNVTVPTFEAPQGFTLVDRADHSTLLGLVAYVRVATGAEPESYTFTSTPSVTRQGWISAYSGVDTTTPVVMHQGLARPTSGTEYVSPTIPALPPKSLVLANFAARCSCVGLFDPISGTSSRARLNNGDHRTAMGVDLPAAAVPAAGLLRATVTPAQDFAVVDYLVLALAR